MFLGEDKKKRQLVEGVTTHQSWGKLHIRIIRLEKNKTKFIVEITTQKVQKTENSFL